MSIEPKSLYMNPLSQPKTSKEKNIIQKTLKLFRRFYSRLTKAVDPARGSISLVHHPVTTVGNFPRFVCGRSRSAADSCFLICPPDAAVPSAVYQKLSGVVAASVIGALRLTSPTASISPTRRASRTLYIKNHLPPVSCPGYLQLPILITMTNPISSHTISVARHAPSVIPTKIRAVFVLRQLPPARQSFVLL